MKHKNKNRHYGGYFYLKKSELTCAIGACTATAFMLAGAKLVFV